MSAAENSLEKALRLAATDPASRPDFYSLLLQSTVFVFGSSGRGVEGPQTIAAGQDIEIANWTMDDGRPVIPFFTSLPALQRALTNEGNYLSLPARDFFEITKGATLFLNPTLDHGKEFLPEEIASLLTDGVNRPPLQRVIQQETTVMLGQPKVLPEELIASLQKLFATRAQVSAAYLCLMHDPSHDEKPHHLLGILADSDYERIVREAGVVVNDTALEPCDIMQSVPGSSGPSSFFLKDCKPFYQRGLGTKLRSLFRS